MDNDECRICGADTRPAGDLKTSFSEQRFYLNHCEVCRYSFVRNPRTDYAALYGVDYYEGRGADTSVDFVGEMRNRKTIREYEWDGILRAVRSLVTIDGRTRWLDYGCGLGGFVRYCHERGLQNVVGSDVGYAAAQARSNGIPVIGAQELEESTDAYDVATAIEVLEHIERPIDTLRLLHRVLRPGGLLFLTTGNAEPYRSKLTSWHYVCPEVHISFFEPETVSTALRLAGFRAEHRRFIPGFENIIRYKVLKVLGVRERSRFEAALPWRALARLVDRKVRASAHPIGWKPGTLSG